MDSYESPYEPPDEVEDHGLFEDVVSNPLRDATGQQEGLFDDQPVQSTVLTDEGGIRPSQSPSHHVRVDNYVRVIHCFIIGYN